MRHACRNHTPFRLAVAKGDAFAKTATQPREGPLSRVTAGDERSELALDRGPSRGYLTESMLEAFSRRGSQAGSPSSFSTSGPSKTVLTLTRLTIGTGAVDSANYNRAEVSSRVCTDCPLASSVPR